MNEERWDEPVPAVFTAMADELDADEVNDHVCSEIVRTLRHWAAQPREQDEDDAFDAWLRWESAEPACPHCGQFKARFAFAAGAAWARTPTLPAGAEEAVKRFADAGCTVEFSPMVPTSTDWRVTVRRHGHSKVAYGASITAALDKVARWTDVDVAGDRPPAEREEG